MFKSWQALKGQLVPQRVCWQNSLLRSRISLTAVKLACLAGDVVLRAPVEHSCLRPVAEVSEAALVAWLQSMAAGELRQLRWLSGHRAGFLKRFGCYIRCLVAVKS